MIILVNIADYALGRFRFYRKWRGGFWAKAWYKGNPGMSASWGRFDEYPTSWAVKEWEDYNLQASDES